MKHEPGDTFKTYLKYARTRLLGSSPFLGVLLIHCKVTERKGTGASNETAYTNGRDVVFYDTLVERISREEFTGILLHEILHVAWLHVQRGKFGHLKPRVWNWATDFVINLVIKDASAELARSLSNVEPFSLPDWVLYDEQYRGMSADAVYQKLLQDIPPELANMPLDGCGGGQGDSAGGDDRSFSNADLKDFLPGYNPDKNLDGDIQQGSAGGPDAGDDDGVGEALSHDELQKAGSDWKQVVSQAAQSAKMQGKLPSYLEKFVEGLLYPKVDWRRLLKDFIQAFPVDYSFMQADRRFADFEFIIPSLHGEQIELTVAVDTSGSFSSEQLREALTEVYDMVSSFDYITLTVISCDAAVQSVETIHSRYEIDKIKLKGGGGTDFQPVFDWIEENQPGCQGLVYFTDMYGTFPDEAPRHKTLWIVSSEFDLDDAPFGQAIRY